MSEVEQGNFDWLGEEAPMGQLTAFKKGLRGQKNMKETNRANGCHLVKKQQYEGDGIKKG